MPNNLASILLFQALNNPTNKTLQLGWADGMTPKALWFLAADRPHVECIILHPTDYAPIALAPESYGVENCRERWAAEQGIMCRLGSTTILQSSKAFPGIAYGLGESGEVIVLKLYKELEK